MQSGHSPSMERRTEVQVSRELCVTLSPPLISNPVNGTIPRGPEKLECAFGAGMEGGSQTEKTSLWALSRGHSSSAILGGPRPQGPFPDSTNHLQGNTGT